MLLAIARAGKRISEKSGVVEQVRRSGIVQRLGLDLAEWRREDDASLQSSLVKTNEADR